MDHKVKAEQFYTSFNLCDSETMNALYADSVSFSDPAFGWLNDQDVRDMWSMLCSSQKGKKFKVSFVVKSVKPKKVEVFWEAWYTFSITGKSVHNQIKSTLFFNDKGLIFKQIDRFSLHRWSRQAMGLTGTLLGWTPFFKSGLQKRSKAALKKYQASLTAR